MFQKPGVLLRVEGAAVLALSLFFYHAAGASWGRFLLLFLWPDLAMLGYAVSVGVGTRMYNSVHTYVGPMALAGWAVHEHQGEFLAFALIWFAHVGFDRALGYGLKYPTYFKDTHLQRVDLLRADRTSPAG